MTKGEGISLLGVKERNRQQIKRVIYRQAPVTRQHITDELGLSLPTITTNVAQMLGEGLLVEYAAPGRSPTGGRRLQLLDFNAAARYAVGVELGPYQTLFCLTDLRGRVCASLALEAASPQYLEMTAFVAQSVRELVQRSGIREERLFGVGVGIPGFIEYQEGVIRTAFHSDWMGRPFVQDLASLLSLPVWIDNNARMRAFGREMFGSGAAPDTFAYFLVSKGLACPLMIKNNVLAGHKASAGEVGHTTILPDGPLCPTCGRRGCLEAVAGESAILSAAAKALAQGKAPCLAALVPPGEAPDTARVLEAQRQGDPAIGSIMEKAVEYLGLEGANIFNFISPSLVVVDGYIFQLEENRRRLQETVQGNLYGLMARETNIEFLPYDRLTGALGAAAFVVRRCLLD